MFFFFVVVVVCVFFFFNDTATTEIYTLSLHDALPIWIQRTRKRIAKDADRLDGLLLPHVQRKVGGGGLFRSEEHTSELQSHSDLVCRLLLEKKKKKNQFIHPQNIFTNANTVDRYEITHASPNA